MFPRRLFHSASESNLAHTLAVSPPRTCLLIPALRVLEVFPSIPYIRCPSISLLYTESNIDVLVQLRLSRSEGELVVAFHVDRRVVSNQLAGTIESVKCVRRIFESVARWDMSPCCEGALAIFAKIRVAEAAGVNRIEIGVLDVARSDAEGGC